MTLLESDNLLNDLVKLSKDGRSKILYLENRRGDFSWENEQTPSQVLEEFISKLERIIAQQPLPVSVVPTRHIRTAIYQCTGKRNVMPMSRV